MAHTCCQLKFALKRKYDITADAGDVKDLTMFVMLGLT
jgi:hypothetical protein